MFNISGNNLNSNWTNNSNNYITAPIDSCAMFGSFDNFNPGNVDAIFTDRFSALPAEYNVDTFNIGLSYSGMSPELDSGISAPIFVPPPMPMPMSMPTGGSIFTGGTLSDAQAADLFQISSLMQPPIFNPSISATNIQPISQAASVQSASPASIQNTEKPSIGQGYSLSLTGANKQELAKIEKIFVENKAKYDKVAQATGVPAELICAIHYREGGCDFTTYLHNGQKLGKRTTVVPKGLLFYDWTEAAIHAIKSQSAYKNVKSNDLSSQLDFAERYNGLGYRKRGVASPYVWAGTSKYKGGMYVADGKYSSATKDKRVGVAAILDRLYA